MGLNEDVDELAKFVNEADELSEKELISRRKTFLTKLSHSAFNSSPDIWREYIEQIDKEIALRHSTKTRTISFVAIAISIISTAIALLKGIAF